MAIATFDLTFVGLLLTAYGGVLLASGIFVPLQVILDETATYYGRNLHLVKARLRQRADALVGMFVILLGSIAQLVAATPISDSLMAPNAESHVGAFAETILPLAVVSVVWWGARAYADQGFFQHAFRQWSDQKPDGFPERAAQDSGFLERQGALQNMRRKRHESDEEYLRRVQQEHTRLGRRYAPKRLGQSLPAARAAS